MHTAAEKCVWSVHPWNCAFMWRVYFLVLQWKGMQKPVLASYKTTTYTVGQMHYLLDYNSHCLYTVAQVETCFVNVEYFVWLHFVTIQSFHLLRDICTDTLNIPR